MKSHNVIFFPDDELEHGIELKKQLKEKYLCFESKNIDEFDQVSRQSGKFLVFFMDVKQAIGFMQENSSALTGMSFRTFAYLNRNGKFKADSQKVLDSARVEAFQKDDVAILVKTIEDFFKGSSSASDLNLDDIQFIMPEDE
jgi:hypothetical protein